MTAAFYTELYFNYVALNSRQGYMTFPTARVQQIENYGEKDERRLAPDAGSGYLWRLISFARFEERDGGLYPELEVIGLSKDLPGSLRFADVDNCSRFGFHALQISSCQEVRADHLQAIVLRFVTPQHQRRRL